MKLYEETWGELMTQQHQFAIQEATAPSILTTWTVSFNEIQKKSPDAANLLILWAFLDNQDIWYEQFTPALYSNLTEELPDWFRDALAANSNLRNCKKHLNRGNR